MLLLAVLAQFWFTANRF